MSSRGLRRLIILIVVLVVVIGGGFAAVQIRDGQRRARALEGQQTGNAAFEAGNYEGTLEGLGRYLAYEPFKGDAQAVYRLAEARSRVPIDRTSRHKLSALGFALEAVRLDPDSVEAHDLLLRLYIDPAIARLTEAIETSERLLELDPDNQEAGVIRVTLLAAADRHEESVELATRLAGANPDDYRLQLLRLEALGRGGMSNDDLLAETDALAEANPDQPAYLIFTADLLRRAGRIDEAREAALRAADSDLSDTAAMRALLETLDTLGLRREADKVLEDLRAREGDTWELALATADRAWVGGQPADALAALRPHTEQLISAQDAVLGFAAFLEYVTNAEQRPLTEALEARPTAEAQAWRSLQEAAEALDAGEIAAARDLLEGARVTLPNNPIAPALLGRVYRAQGESLNAIRLYERATQISPRWVGPRVELADLFMERGSAVSARFNAAIAVQAAPNSVPAREALFEASTMAYAAGDIDRDPETNPLASELRRYAELPQYRPRAIGRLARIAIADGDLALAESYIDELIETDAPLPTSELTRLVDAAESANITGLSALAEASPVNLLTEALDEARAGRADAGKVMLREAADKAEGDDKVAADMRLAIYLDQIGDPEALESIMAVTREYENNAAVQRDALRLRSIWTDRDASGEVIGRLERLTGETGVNWRVYKARRILAWDRTEQAAAEALSLLESVLRVAPENVDALMLAADAAGLLDQRELAVGYLEEAARAAPDRADVSRLYAEALTTAGRGAEGAAVLRSSLGNPRLPDAERVILIEQLLENGLTTEARAEIDLLSDDASRKPSLLAVAEALDGNTSRARNLFDRAVAREGVSPDVLTDAAEFYLQVGDEETAWATLDRAMPDATEADRLRARAALAIRVGVSGSAERAAAALAQLGDAGPDELRVLVAASLRRGDLDGARAAAENAETPADVRRAVAVASAARSAGRNELVRTIGRIVSEDSERAGELIELAERRLADPPSVSLDALAAFASGHPVWTASWIFYGSELVAAGDTAEAVRVFSIATERISGEAVLPALGWEIAAGRGDWVAAEQLARAWRDRATIDPFAADVALATSLARQGGWAEARRILDPLAERIIADGDERPRDLVTYAEALVTTGDEEQGERLLRERIGRGEAWVAAYAQLWTRFPSQATRRAFLTRAAEVLASNTAGVAVLAQAWLQDAETTQDESSARNARDLLSGLTDDPRFAGPAEAMIARASELLGETEAAIAAYRRAVELNPDNILALNNLAFLLLEDETNDGDEAAELAARAVESLRRSGSSNTLVAQGLDTLGDAQRRRQAWDEAITASSEALEIGLGLDITRRASILADLAEAQLGAGRRSEAAANLSRAEELIAAERNEELSARVAALRARLDT